ncbi:MAG TPA: hypothetical protein VIO38_07530, partial [Rariglobus sp.]
MVPADDVVAFTRAASECLAGCREGARLSEYADSQGYACLVQQISEARRAHKALTDIMCAGETPSRHPPASPGPSTNSRDAVGGALATPPSVGGIAGGAGSRMDIVVETNPPHSTAATDDDDDLDLNAPDAGPPPPPPPPPSCPVLVQAEANDPIAQRTAALERNHNRNVAEGMASHARSDRPLCVWERKGSTWRLAFAVRPGADAARPW